MSENGTGALHQNGEGGLGPLHRAVERIALDRFAASLADQLQQLAAAQSLGGGGAGIVVDPLFDDRAVEIVGAESQRDLRDPRASSSPSRP